MNGQQDEQRHEVESRERGGVASDAAERIPSSKGPAEAPFKSTYPRMEMARVPSATSVSAMLRVRSGVSRLSNAPLMKSSGSVASNVTGMLPICSIASQYKAAPAVGDGMFSTLLSCAHVPRATRRR